MKNLPCDLSALIGYTKIDLVTDFSDPNTTQKLAAEFSMKSLTIEALIKMAEAGTNGKQAQG